MNEIETERKKLDDTIKIVNEVLQREQLNLEELYNSFDGSREELWHIADMTKITRYNL